MSQATFDANLSQTKLIRRQRHTLTLQTISPQVAERINQQLRPLIERALADYTGCSYQIQAQATNSPPALARPSV